MHNCSNCGGRLRRIHRTFVERFSYMAIYQCRQCNRVEHIPRRYQYHLGSRSRCPKCGTYRIAKLKEPDKIDPMQSGFLNLLERLAGGSLRYCCFCRLQFYDRRAMAPRNGAHPAPEPEDITHPPDTAKSGV